MKELFNHKDKLNAIKNLDDDLEGLFSRMKDLSNRYEHYADSLECVDDRYKSEKRDYFNLARELKWGFKILDDVLNNFEFEERVDLMYGPLLSFKAFGRVYRETLEKVCGFSNLYRMSQKLNSHLLEITPKYDDKNICEAFETPASLLEPRIFSLLVNFNLVLNKKCKEVKTNDN